MAKYVKKDTDFHWLRKLINSLVLINRKHHDRFLKTHERSLANILYFKETTVKVFPHLK